MSRSRPLVLLDRDGVLNEVVVDPEHGTVDSPLHPSQVRVFPWVPEALALLERSGFGLAIVTNQPSAAKGRTTRANLSAVHEMVVAAATSAGATILSSHVCYHRSEDGCSCRKPRTGLLEEAFGRNPGADLASSWMVGDGVTDVEAGRTMGLKVGFLGPRKCDACRILSDRRLEPDFWGDNLLAFARHVGGQVPR